jgi:hypothetical protein
MNHVLRKGMVFSGYRNYIGGGLRGAAPATDTSLIRPQWYHQLSGAQQ